MPQSIQIVPKWSYPYVETIINDYSQVVDKTQIYPIDPVVTYAFPFVSPKGIDNTFVRKYSVSRFEATFGKSNYKKYGQPLMMPYAVLNNPNVYVWGMRVMPVNAAYSNNLITLKYRIDKKSDGVDPSQRKFRINFTQRALEDINTNKEFIDVAYAIYKDPSRTHLQDDIDNPPVVGEYTLTQYIYMAGKDNPDAIREALKDPDVKMVVDDSVLNLDDSQVHYSDVIATVYSKNEFELVTLQREVDEYRKEHEGNMTPENINKALSDKLDRIDKLIPIVEKYRLNVDPDEVENTLEVQAIRNIEVGDYVKAYDWKIAPFMGVRSAGRGVYGDNYRIRISPNTNYEKEYGIKMFDFQILSMEEGLQTIASYTGALSSSDKYESITLINDILENADEGDVPVYVYVSEENLKVVYDEYVSFLKELHPDLIDERDYKLDRYTEAYRINKGLDVATAQLQMDKMIKGKQRAYSNDRIVIDDEEASKYFTLAATTKDFRALEIVEDNRQYYDNTTMVRLSEVQGKIPNYIHVSSKAEGARLVVSNEFPAQSFRENKMIRIGSIDTSDRPVSINDYVAKTGIGNYVVRGIVKSTLEMVNEIKNLNNLINATLDKNIVDFDQFDPLYAQKVASSALIPCISFSDGVTTNGSIPIFAETSGIALKKGSDGYFADPRYVEILEDGDTNEPSIVYPYKWTHPVTTMIAPERIKVIRYEKIEYSVVDTKNVDNDGNPVENGVSYLEIIDNDAEDSKKGQIMLDEAKAMLESQGVDPDTAEVGKFLKSTPVYFEQVTKNEYMLYDRMYTGGKNKLQVIDDDDTKNYDIQTQVEKSDVIEGLNLKYTECLETDTDTGKLLIVQADAEDFNERSQIKVDDATLIADLSADGKTPTVGKFVRKCNYMRCDSRRDGAIEVISSEITDTVPANKIKENAPGLKRDIPDIKVGEHVLRVMKSSIYVDDEDPLYVIKKVNSVPVHYREYTIVSADTAGALKVVADADFVEGDATTVKISDVNGSHNKPNGVITATQKYVISTPNTTGALEVVAATVKKYVMSTSGTTGALEVVKDKKYVMSTSGTTGALEVVAASTIDPIDSTTQIKEDDSNLVADLPSVQVGDYVILQDVTPTSTQIKVNNAILVADLPSVQVGDYVIQEDVENIVDSTTQIREDDSNLLADLPSVQVGDYVIQTEVATYVTVENKTVPMYKKYSIDEEELEFDGSSVDDLLDIFSKVGTTYPPKTFIKNAVYVPRIQTDIIYLYPDEDTGKMPVDDDEKGPIIHEDGSINTSRVAYTTDAIQWTLQQEIDECLINAFNGTYDRKILSPRRIPVDAWFDANYSFAVKQALCELVTARNDAPVFLDTGIEDKVYSTERMNALIDQYKEFTNDTAKYNTKLISKNLQHYKIREEGTMKRVDVSITYFLAKKFAEHVLNYGTHFPFVKGKCELSGHLRDTLQPALEDFEAEKKELLYNNHFNYFETRADNIFQRASQSTSQAELSDLSEENNIFTLYNLKRILENDIHDSLYDFADANSRQTFTAFETAKFAPWIGTKVLSLSIHFDVSEWEFDHSILHCYVAVVFRGLQKRAILEIDINKRVYDSETESTAGSVAI